QPGTDDRLGLAAAVARCPRRVGVGGVDEVSALGHVRVEDGERGLFVGRPAEHAKSTGSVNKDSARRRGGSRGGEGASFARRSGGVAPASPAVVPVLAALAVLAAACHVLARPAPRPQVHVTWTRASARTGG